MRPQEPTDRSSAGSPALDARSSEGVGALVRLGWMLGGTLTMLIAGFTIASRPVWTLSVRDIVFWSGALLAVTLRYWDIEHFHGQTSTGEPATRNDFWRYCATLSVIAIAAWVAAQSVHI